MDDLFFRCILYGVMCGAMGFACGYTLRGINKREAWERDEGRKGACKHG